MTPRLNSSRSTCFEEPMVRQRTENARMKRFVLLMVSAGLTLSPTELCFIGGEFDHRSSSVSSRKREI